MPGGGYGRFGRRVVGPLIVVAGLLFSSGCGSDDAAVTPRPPIQIMTSTSSLLPTHARPSTEKAAADAVISRYFAIVNRLDRVEDVVGLRHLMLSTCNCYRQVQAVAQAARLHERYTQRAAITRERASRVTSTQFRILVQFNETAGGLQRRDGTYALHSSSRVDAADVFYVIERGSRWLIAGITSLH